MHISGTEREVIKVMISTKGRYALRLMLDLAENQKNGYVALKDIAKRQDISKKYLEQIVPMLNKSGLLLTTRGYQGGYRLAKSADECTVGDILRVTEGSIAPVTCLESQENPCKKADSCITLGVWRGLYDVISEYLDSITLQTILDNNRKQSTDEYYI